MQVSGKKIVLLGAIVGALTIAVVLVLFRSLGWERFQANTKLQEGKRNVITIARALIVCADNGHKLPESSKPVPGTLADVGGKVFQSTPEAWSDPTWDCAKYSQTGEQRFRYQFVRKSDDEGTVRAEADFDANGSAEAVYEQDILCGVYSGEFRCRPGDFRDIAQMR
jgi:hypothetical protein